MNNGNKALFSLGAIYMRQGVADVLERANQLPILFPPRHRVGDWGELDAEDVAYNNAAVRDGERLLSAYTTPAGEKL